MLKFGFFFKQSSLQQYLFLKSQLYSCTRNVLCVSRGAKSVGRDNICRKGQYVSEGAKCVGKDNICRTAWTRKCGAKSVGKDNMCRKGQNVSEKKNFKKSLTVSLKGILWILFRHIVQLNLPTEPTYQRLNKTIISPPFDQFQGSQNAESVGFRQILLFPTHFGCPH